MQFPRDKSNDVGRKEGRKERRKEGRKLWKTNKASAKRTSEMNLSVARG